MASRTSSDVLSAKRDRPIKPQKILPAKAHNPVLQHNRSEADIKQGEYRLLCRILSSRRFLRFWPRPCTTMTGTV
jgi:hypothetical protein